MSDPFIIMCAPNGARRQKTDHANIPLTSAELADCAEEVLLAGASILHLHVRTDEGRHSLSVDRYRDAIQAIRARVGDKLVLQTTSEAVGQYSRAQQVAMVKELRPEAVSLALREICPDDAAEPDTKAFFAWMRDHRIFPQIILYNEADTRRFERMRQAGLFGIERPFVLCVLGKYGDEAGNMSGDLNVFTNILSPAQVPWAVCGFGKNEHRLAEEAAKRGGHVRVGFENNLQRVDGGFAEDNAELVKCANQSAQRVQGTERPIATAEDVRQQFMWG